jgi:hypothetical protein
LRSACNRRMSAASRPGSGDETTSANVVRNPPASVSGSSIVRSSGTRRIATGSPQERPLCVPKIGFGWTRHGSRCSAADIEEPPMGEERWIGATNPGQPLSCSLGPRDGSAVPASCLRGLERAKPRSQARSRRSSTQLYFNADALCANAVQGAERRGLGRRAPLVVRWPGVIRPGTVKNQLFAALDWLPTFVDIAGDDVLAELDYDSRTREVLQRTLKYRRRATGTSPRKRECCRALCVSHRNPSTRVPEAPPLSGRAGVSFGE